MLSIQVTLFDKTGKYKPVSTLVKCESIDYFHSHKAEIRTQGIVKICQKRYWTNKDLKRYGYTTCKMRVYEK